MFYSSRMIRQVRPQLYTVAPMTYYICWGFAIVNFFIAIGLWILEKPALPISVANFLSLRQWSVIFVTLGGLGIFGLLSNRWELSRNIMLGGVLVKSIWMIALVIRSFMYHQTAIFSAVWLFLAYIQILTYIFFIPRIRESGSE